MVSIGQTISMRVLEFLVLIRSLEVAEPILLLVKEIKIPDEHYIEMIQLNEGVLALKRWGGSTPWLKIIAELSPIDWQAPPQ